MKRFWQIGVLTISSFFLIALSIDQSAEKRLSSFLKVTAILIKKQGCQTCSLSWQTLLATYLQNENSFEGTSYAYTDWISAAHDRSGFVKIAKRNLTLGNDVDSYKIMQIRGQSWVEASGIEDRSLNKRRVFLCMPYPYVSIIDGHCDRLLRYHH